MSISNSTESNGTPPPDLANKKVSAVASQVETDTLPLPLDFAVADSFVLNSFHADESIAKPSIDQSFSPSFDQSVEVSAEQDLGVLLVGLAIDQITTVEATLVKGRENGVAAIAFDQWLIPFDDVMQAIGGSVTPSEDGLLVIRAPGLATVIDPQTLQSDPDIGQVLSIATIEKDLGIPAVFDLSQYAIKFSPPVLNNPAQPDLSWFFEQSDSQLFPSGSDGRPTDRNAICV